MGLSLPFSPEQFLDVFGAYNRAWWPVAAALWIATMVAIGRLVAGRRSDRFVAAVLGVQWLWSGIVYHVAYFAEINPVARAFGLLFIAQGTLLIARGVIRSRLTFRWGRAPNQLLSAGLSGFAVVYPLLAVASGLEWPRLPTFGVPCPTVLLTVGLLLSVEARDARSLGIIPLIWTVVGGSGAMLLGVLPDYMLLVAGVLLLAHLLTPRLVIGARAA